MKQIQSASKTVRKQIRNIIRFFLESKSLQDSLIQKINRHETSVAVSKAVLVSDFSDARHYEHFTRHSTHYSSRNFI